MIRYTFDMSTQRVPTSIFSGFLGSGKTTIILHLVEQLQAAGEQVVYIKNEIGDADIDSLVMKSKQVTTKTLLNGCICCTLVGAFASTLTEVVTKYKPTRVLIEASGAADPSALALAVSSHPLLVRDAVIGVIDVVNFTGFTEITVTAQSQSKFIDLIVFNKVEMEDLTQKRRVVEYVREVNTHAPIIEAPKGVLLPDAVFGWYELQLESGSDTKKSINTIPREHIEHIDHDDIGAFSLAVPEPISRGDLQTFLASLPKALFRVKGIVTLTDGQTILCNKVGSHTDIQELQSNRTTLEPVLIFIGVGAKKYQKQVAESLGRLTQ